MAAVLAILREWEPSLVGVGHGRDEESAARARAFLDAWDGDVAQVVSWPAEAASWLRPARRLARGGADAWVIAERRWAGIGARLATIDEWDPARTVLFGGPVVPHHRAAGLRGVLPDGTTWQLATDPGAANPEPGDPTCQAAKIGPGGPARRTAELGPGAPACRAAKIGPVGPACRAATLGTGGPACRVADAGSGSGRG